MKLHRLTLKCFRGFPFKETLLFHGKNVLLYGENGSGKSTLFHALREALPRTRQRKPIGEFTNAFIEPPGTPPPSSATVHLEFRRIGALDDPAQAQTVTWNHATAANCTGWEFQAARRIMALDYRAVLETHYVQRTEDELNIYPLLAQTIVGSAENTTVSGSARPTFREQWKNIVDRTDEQPSRRYYHRYKLQHVYDLIESLHKGLKGIEPLLLPLANDYLTRLSTGLKIGLDVKEAPWYEAEPRQRQLTSEGKALVTAEFFGTPVSHPAPFFNEARLSAMALALYLAGVRLSVPDKNLEPQAYPRVLILDDVLIGLDLAHRLPLLRLLAEHFSDWQVLLFTHDRAWFDLAQLEIAHRDDWCCYELQARPIQHTLPGGAQTVIEIPLVKPPEGTNVINHYLALADTALNPPMPSPGVPPKARDERMAGLYTRVAFESKLKSHCSDKSIQVSYKLNPGELKTKDFLDAIERRLKWDGTYLRAFTKIERVKMFLEGVLNPLAHCHPVTLHAGEIESAIAAVRELDFGKGAQNHLLQARNNLPALPAILSDAQRLKEAVYLRVAFEVSVRYYLLRRGGKVTYRDDWRNLPLADLWIGATERLATELNGPTLSSSLAAHPVFHHDWTYGFVSGLQDGSLRAAFAALHDPGSPPANPATFLDAYA